MGMSCPKFRLAISDLSTLEKVAGVLDEALVAETINSSVRKSLDSILTTKSPVKGMATVSLLVS